MAGKRQNSASNATLPPSKRCLYCGLAFITRNPRRLYCSERCRRDFQNERRAEERAERRAAREAARWDDPWERDDWAIMANALLDASPVFEDTPWGGVSVKLPKPNPKRKKKEKNPGWLWLPGVPQ